MEDRAIGSGRRHWRGEDEGTAAERVRVLATVAGTDGNDFIHRAHDGLETPPGYNKVTGVTTGDDTIDGGAGDDIVYGDDGNDLIFDSLGTDEVHGGAGQDKFLVTNASQISGFAETIDGGDGFDDLQLNPDSSDQSFDFTTLKLVSVEELSSNLSVSGISVYLSSTQLFGLSSIYTAADLYIAGELLDVSRLSTLVCDNIFLGDSKDKLVIAGNVGFFGTLSTGGGNDHISIENAASIQDLHVDGGSGNDNIDVRGGLAILEGETGNDQLDGGRFADRLDGGDDADALNGHAGQDMLTGGAGADLFAISRANDSKVGDAKHDIIADFSHAEGDRIGLLKIDADTMQLGDQAFHLVDGNAFTGHAGELIQVPNGSGDTLVQGDVNGDGRADFEIALNHAPVLVATDFVL